MPPQQNSGHTQLQILRTFTTLYQLCPEYGGSLILSLGLDTAGAALSIAANIAGAVSLAIDNDPTNLRDVIRTGACDFVVNTLDEAIRAMKNEVRKRAPLSVALNADPFIVLAEILERGLSPQMFSTFLQSPHQTPDQANILSQAAHQFQSEGTSLIAFSSGQSHPQSTPFTVSDTLLIPFVTDHCWALYTPTFDTPATLRAFDTRAISLLSEDDKLRRRWLQAAPQILQRERPHRRALWLTDQEKQILQTEFTLSL